MKPMMMGWRLNQQFWVDRGAGNVLFPTGNHWQPFQEILLNNKIYIIYTFTIFRFSLVIFLEHCGSNLFLCHVLITLHLYPTSPRMLPFCMAWEWSTSTIMPFSGEYQLPFFNFIWIKPVLAQRSRRWFRVEHTLMSTAFFMLIVKMNLLLNT